jgi:hypothetical protein
VAEALAQPQTNLSGWLHTPLGRADARLAGVASQALSVFATLELDDG